MVSFELSDVSVFKEVLSVVGKYMEDTLRFELTDEGLGFTCLDKPHIVFITSVFKKEWFTIYDIGEGVSFVVDVRELNQALSRINNSASVSCSLNDDYLILNSNGLNGIKSFKLRLVDDSYEPPSPPNIPYSGSVSVDLSVLKEYTLDAVTYGGKLSYTLTDGDELIIKSENDYTLYEAKMPIVNTDAEPCKVTLSSEKLVDLFKLKSLDDTILKLGNDFPLTVNLMNNIEDVRFQFMIAPRLEEDV